ncbi:MAG: hypothetical protein Q8742_02000 [Candidatus Phytoplasma australasiaticum]|nr:hypothetical protein [Candidatus Phytoplasma australasiaticum]
MKTSQHLLTKDKNYYLGEAFVNNNNLKLTNFHLQLNHVSKTLSIFKDKHNNDNRKKTENNKKPVLTGNKNYINFRYIKI